MRALKCDSCGKLYMPYAGKNVAAIRERDYGLVQTIRTVEYDLCEECMTKVLKALSAEESVNDD